MTPPVFSLSAASPSVVALIGSPPRIWQFGVGPSPSDPPYGVPYATWQTVGGFPENYLGNTPDADSYTVQIDVYANTQEQSRQVAEALRDAYEPSAYVTRWGVEMREPETGHYRVNFDVDFIVQR